METFNKSLNKYEIYKVKIRKKISPQQYFRLESGLLEWWNENVGKSSSPQKQQNISEITLFRTLVINQSLTIKSIVITQEKLLNLGKNGKVFDV